MSAFTWKQNYLVQKELTLILIYYCQVSRALILTLVLSQYLKRNIFCNLLSISLFSLSPKTFYWANFFDRAHFCSAFHWKHQHHLNMSQFSPTKNSVRKTTLRLNVRLIFLWRTKRKKATESFNLTMSNIYLTYKVLATSIP